MAVAHYLEALDFQKEIVKIHTIFGGKNPHPNWLVGGVPCPINIDGTGARRRHQHGAAEPGFRRSSTSRSTSSIRSTSRTCSPSPASTRTGSIGGGLSSTSLMSYGDIPEHANDYSDKSLQLAARRHPQRQPGRGPRSRPDRRRCRCRNSSPTPGTNTPTSPRACIPGTALPSRTTCSAPTPRAPRPAIEALDEGAKYSWIKSPRWKGNAMEVGPLARYVIGYAQNKPEFKEPVDQLLERAGRPRHRAVLHARAARRRAVWNAPGRRTSCATSRTS